MAMARTQTLVQLTDELLALLDEWVTRLGIDRMAEAGTALRVATGC